MKSQEKLCEICIDIYREMYREADPPADFDKMVKTGEAKQNNFWKSYYLPQDKFEEIIDRHMDNNKLTKKERNKMSFSVNLGCSPCSVDNRWNKEENI